MLTQALQRFFNAAPQSALGRALAACGRHVEIIFAFSAVINVLYLAPSIYMLQVYDRVLTTRSVETLLFVSLALLLAFAALGAVDLLRGRLVARLALKLERRLATDALNASFARAGGGRRGEATRALDNIRLAFTGPGMIALADLPWAPLYIVVCFLLHPALGVAALAGAAAVAALAVASERAQRRPLAASLEAAAAAAASHDAAAAGGDVARALGMREALLERDRGLRDDAAATGAGALAQQSGYASATKVTRLVVQSGLLGLGGYLAIIGQISPGAIIAASIMAARALAPIDMIVGSWRQLAMARDGFATLGRLLTALDLRPPGMIALPRPAARLQAERVVVSAGEGQRPIVAGASLVLEPGEVVALSGPSGAGKTTLARVLVGALAPTSGAARLDGVDLDLWDDSALGRLIGYMPQQPALFPGSIADNISRFARYTGMGDSEVMTRVVAAARLAGAHDMITKLHGGYASTIGAAGLGLSVGQAQRIALARAMFDDPIAFVLDEPNASLDQEGEAALLRCLVELKRRGACVLVVTHRASLNAVIDRIAIMRNGEIERIGPKSEFVGPARPQRPVVAVSNDAVGASPPPEE